MMNEVWDKRYVIPGIVAVVVALLGFWPEVRPVLQAKDGVGQVLMAMAVLVASLPLGYVLFAAFEIMWRIRGGTSGHVDHAALACALRDRGVVGESATADDRTLFMVIWHSQAPVHLRTHCQRYWEEAYTCLGTGFSSALAGFSVLLYWVACRLLGKGVDFGIHRLNCILAAVIVLFLMSVKARRMIRAVVSVENAWIGMTVARLRGQDADVFEMIEVPLGCEGDHDKEPTSASRPVQCGAVESETEREI